MVGEIGRIARLADNAQCTSYHLAKSVDSFSITGPMAQKKYSSVLGWDSPFDGVCKLEREKERMENTNTLGEYVTLIWPSTRSTSTIS